MRVITSPGICICLPGRCQGRGRRKTALEMLPCKVITHSEDQIQGGGSSASADRELEKVPEDRGARALRAFSLEGRVMLKPEGLYPGSGLAPCDNHSGRVLGPGKEGQRARWELGGGGQRRLEELGLEESVHSLFFRHLFFA